MRTGSRHGESCVRMEWLESRLQFDAGGLDAQFATAGVLRRTFRDSSSFSDVVTQPDGAIIAVGQARRAGLSAGALIARFTADGRPDRTFGIDGVMILNLGSSADDLATAVAVEPSTQKIIIAGIADSGSDSDMFVARFTSRGRLDLAFGRGGIARIDFNGRSDAALGLVLEDDGKVAVSGFSASTSGNSSVVALTRLQSNGRLDRTFGLFGRAITGQAPGSFEIGARLDQQDDGKYVVAMTRLNLNRFGEISSSALGALRVLSDGSVDLAFGSFGRALARFANSVQIGADIALDPRDGDIVVAGTTANGLFSFGALLPSNLTFGAVSDATIADFAVARFNSRSGLLDPSFSRDGRQIVNFRSGSFSRLDAATSVQVDSQGRIYLGGSSLLPGEDSDFAAARLLSDGVLDSSFSGDGRRLYNLRGSNVALASTLTVTEGGESGVFLLAGQTTSDDEQGSLLLAVQTQ